jgi:hypothetical protein
MEGTLAFSGRASMRTSEPANRHTCHFPFFTYMQRCASGKQMQHDACLPILDRYCKAPLICFTCTPTMDVFRLMFSCFEQTHALAAQIAPWLLDVCIYSLACRHDSCIRGRPWLPRSQNEDHSTSSACHAGQAAEMSFSEIGAGEIGDERSR